MKTSDSLQTSPSTVQELLDAAHTHIANRTNRTHRQASKQMSAIRCVANHLCQCLGKSPDQALISEVADLGADFKSHLEARKLSRKRILELTYNKNSLLRFAKQFGYSSNLFTLQDEWEPIHRAVKSHRHAAGYQIVRYAIERQIRQSDFSDTHLQAFIADRKRRGNTHQTIIQTVWSFKSAIRAAKLHDRFPLLDLKSGRGTTYYLRLSQMTPGLKEEVTEILAWMRARSEAGRVRMRSTTEDMVLLQLEQMLGYAENVRNLGQITSLRQILTKRFMRGFLRWLNIDRGCRRSGIDMKLRLLRLILTEYPSFRDQDFGWINDMIREIRADEESEILSRREARQAPYEKLAQIHGAIQRMRLRGRNLSRKAKARLVHDELLMLWLVVFPWYPRCLRECRIGSPSGNVFKAEVPHGSLFKLTASAEKALAENPDAKLWQFYFRAEETPDGHEERGLLPTVLVRLLETYLSKYRPLLVGHRSTDTLFVNPMGGALTSHQLTQCVGRLTARHLEKWISPSAFRPAFGRYWLGVHPGDYHTLGAILWTNFTHVKQLFDPNYREWRPTNHKKIAA